MNPAAVDEYIDKQSFIAAVEKFSFQHDMKLIDKNKGIYRDLLPKKTPGQGQQYAFEVDLDKCTGCKACVTACHNENGLDEDETWRSVGLLQGGTSSNPALQHITTACHHCAEPACMQGCPTKAYEKDPATGIVKHLDDQCFGCQYCILKCPYDVPKYNKKKGIVHKCDMCVNRLKVGEAPACTRACPTGAIRITIVDTQDVKTNSKNYVNIPDAPASDYTYPTTQYKTNRILPKNMVSADYHTINPEHSHLPLVFMLVLTQLSVGAFLAEIIFNYFLNTGFGQAFFPVHVGAALSLGLLALASSILHLGRPQYAFRAILGVMTSWLSREILAFGLFAKLAILYAVCSWFEPVRLFLQGIFGEQVLGFIAAGVFVSGLLGILCSVMVYRDTKRPFWDNHQTTLKFLGTMVNLGFTTIFLASAIFVAVSNAVDVSLIMPSFGNLFCRIIIAATLFKLLLEATIFFYLPKNDLNFLKKTAILMTRQLKRQTLLRFGCGLIGGVLFPVILIQSQNLSAMNISVCAFFMFNIMLAGELMERYLFFSAVAPLKMPGGQAS